MALVKQCNRCKKIIDDEHLRMEFEHGGKHVFGALMYQIHLCPDCEKAFHDFLDTPPFDPLAGIEVNPQKKQTLFDKIFKKK